VPDAQVQPGGTRVIVLDTSVLLNFLRVGGWISWFDCRGNCSWSQTMCGTK
jgi:hypothetical protein